MKNKAIILIILAGCFFWTQRPVLAQWTPPPGNPPEGSAHLFINPMIENLDLNSFNLFDDNTGSVHFLLDPGGPMGLRLESSGLDWAGYFGKTYVSELCIGANDDPANCFTELGGDSFWRASSDNKGIYYQQSDPDHLGNVGINMTEPRYSLEVGRSYDDDSAIINIQDADNNAYTGLRLEIGSGASAAEKWFIGTNNANSGHSLLFRASGTDRMKLAQTGELRLIGDNANLYMYGYGENVGGNIELSPDATVDGVDISDYSDYFIDDAGSNGRVWTSDGAGRGYWGAVGGGGGDGYIGLPGTHTAGGPLNMGNFNLSLSDEWISNDGQDEGISIDNNGTVILSGNLVSQTGAMVVASIAATGGSNLNTLNANSISTGSLTASTYAIINGQVGIGTNLPSHQLHLYRSFGDNSELDIQSVAGAGNHWGIYQDRASADLFFWQEDNQVVFTDEGRVGIGLDNPAYTLDVNGTFNATSLNASTANLTSQLRINRPANSDAVQFLGGTNPHTIRFDSQDLRFWTPNASEVMRLRQDTGNVGIGTGSPGYRLDVAGSIHGTSYFSSDGSAGLTRTINVGTCTITVKNGLITATTCP